jgi:4a-hydroxytetrahydrobiopterin dehydratase
MMSDNEIHARLGELSGWRYDGVHIHKSFVFGDFSEAFAFLTRVALISEKLNHHPDWSGVYNKVTLKLRTHDADGITDKDINFARRVEAMFH